MTCFAPEFAKCGWRRLSLKSKKDHVAAVAEAGCAGGRPLRGDATTCGPTPNASQPADTPSALAKDSITSTPDWPPFSILANALGLSPPSRASAALVKPFSSRLVCRRTPMVSQVPTVVSAMGSPIPYASQAGDTFSASANRAIVLTVGMRVPCSMSRTVAWSPPSFWTTAFGVNSAACRALRSRVGKPKCRGFLRPRTIDTA